MGTLGSLPLDQGRAAAHGNAHLVPIEPRRRSAGLPQVQHASDAGFNHLEKKKAEPFSQGRV